MLARLTSLFFLIALAGRVLAQTEAPQFVLTVGAANFTAGQLLAVPNDPPALTACATECDAASSAIDACNDTPSCLCNNATLTSLQSCEQCMFNFLIERNVVQTDVRLGGAPVLAAYAATCNATTGEMPDPGLTALTLPPFWVGPDGIFLPTPVLAIGVITAFLMGTGSIILLSNL